MAVVVAILRRPLHVDHKWGRNDPPLMLELSPRLVEARLWELGLEGDNSSRRTNRNTTVLAVFVVALGAVSVIFVMATAMMLFAKGMAVHELLQILADDDQVPLRAEIRLEIRHRLVVAGDVVGEHRLMAGVDRSGHVERDRVPVHLLGGRQLA